MMIWTRRQRGLGLIEILFGIVISSLIVLYGISSVRQQRQNEAVEQTVSEIKHLLQLAVMYHAREDSWPEGTVTFKGRGQLSEAELCSPWPGDGVDPNSNRRNTVCPDRAVYHVAPFANQENAKMAKYFGIGLRLQDPRLVSRIGALLPASILTDSHTVMAYVSALIRPKQQKGWLMSGGIINNGGVIRMPQCPEGYEGHFIETPQYFTGDTRDYFWLGKLLNWGKYYVNFHYSLDSSPGVKNARQGPYIITRHIKHENSKSFYSLAYFLTLCLPDGSWDYQTGSSARVGQCSYEWQQYNTGVKAQKC